VEKNERVRIPSLGTVYIMGSVGERPDYPENIIAKKIHSVLPKNAADWKSLYFPKMQMTTNHFLTQKFLLFQNTSLNLKKHCSFKTCTLKI